MSQGHRIRCDRRQVLAMQRKTSLISSVSYCTECTAGSDADHGFIKRNGRRLYG